MASVLLSILLAMSIPSAPAVPACTDTVMVRLLDVVPDLHVDVRYATTNNFTKRVLYPHDTLWARACMATALAHAQRLAAEQGYKLKVFDAYRPLSVQRLMWSILPDERYVADPAKGSRHNRGMAVDCTLLDGYGHELDMGTPYDDFSERAWTTYADLPTGVCANRKLLQSIMHEAGFDVLPTEWWHFDCRGWEQMGILNE
ncbi:MAG: D-alanyl-D-alanine dipeptidase [Candidatus Kapabacteria bacterium]|nr:D-alanyl-D-alanine dipeptidase [Candidatus Kapabacteria bacterium]